MQMANKSVFKFTYNYYYISFNKRQADKNNNKKKSERKAA